jgi:hypothetical protein
MMEGEVCPWSHLAAGSMSFCERRLCAWVVEPANTWSNLAYIFVGLYLVWRQRGALKSSLTTFGVTSIIVGIGSMFFHGTGTRIGEVIDVSAMYLISGLFVAFPAKRLWALSEKATVGVYAALCAVSTAWLLLSYSNGIWLFAAQVTAAGLMEIALFRRDRPQLGAYRELLWMSIAFALAFTAWFLDVRKLMCDPDNHIFGGHAFWHCSNSLCLLFYWRFHRKLRRETA